MMQFVFSGLNFNSISRRISWCSSVSKADFAQNYKVSCRFFFCWRQTSSPSVTACGFWFPWEMLYGYLWEVPSTTSANLLPCAVVNESVCLSVCLHKKWDYFFYGEDSWCHLNTQKFMPYVLLLSKRLLLFILIFIHGIPTSPNLELLYRYLHHERNHRSQQETS